MALIFTTIRLQVPFPYSFQGGILTQF